MCWMVCRTACRTGGQYDSMIPKLLVSPAEPPSLRVLGVSSLLTERRGVDFLFPVPCSPLDPLDPTNTETRMAGIQRKEFPGDFLSSSRDGRLSKELQQMSGLAYAVLMLEGRANWTADGHLFNSFSSSLTRDQLDGFLFSLWWQYGIAYVWSDNLTDTAHKIQHLVNWLCKPSHHTLRARPKCQHPWASGQNADWQNWLLQSFPGIGVKTGDAIIEHFGRVPLQWTCTEKELIQVPGVGKLTAQTLINFLPAQEESRELTCTQTHTQTQTIVQAKSGRRKNVT